MIDPPPRSITRLINHRDNKYFPDNLEEQRLHSLATRPKSDHDHDWEGKPKTQSDNVIIQREWIRAARFASEKVGFVKTGLKTVAYDPSGQGKDTNAVVCNDGNIITSIEEWVKSPDLREASNRAFDIAVDFEADTFVFDVCGGLGDGVSVFVSDRLDEVKAKNPMVKEIDIFPFDAGSSIVDPDDEIKGTSKTWGELYSNAKAQAHAVTAQKLYNTFRFVTLGERDIEPADMISINIDDEAIFNKLTKEWSTPLWVKSSTNSKKES